MGNVWTKRRRSVRPRHILRDKSKADVGGSEDDKRAQNDCVEVRDNWPGGCQDVNRPGFGMRMIRFHVHDALVIRSRQLRKMRMNQRGAAAIRMYME